MRGIWIAALLLTGCSNERSGAVEDAGYDGGVDALADSGFEQRIGDLESQLEEQRSRIDSLEGDLAVVQAQLY